MTKDVIKLAERGTVRHTEVLDELKELIRKIEDGEHWEPTACIVCMTRKDPGNDLSATDYLRSGQQDVYQTIGLLEDVKSIVLREAQYIGPPRED